MVFSAPQRPVAPELRLAPAVPTLRASAVAWVSLEALARAWVSPEVLARAWVSPEVLAPTWVSLEAVAPASPIPEVSGDDAPEARPEKGKVEESPSL